MTLIVILLVTVLLLLMFKPTRIPVLVILGALLVVLVVRRALAGTGRAGALHVDRRRLRKRSQRIVCNSRAGNGSGS